MEKVKEVNFENTQETQALENALRIFVRMIVRTVMSETSIQRNTAGKIAVESATLSPKFKELVQFSCQQNL